MIIPLLNFYILTEENLPNHNPVEYYVINHRNKVIE